MTNDQLDELERLAKAAFDLGEIVAMQDEPAWYDEQAATMGGRLPPEDAAFIAAANPAAVLELIAAARAGWQPIETHDGSCDSVIVYAPPYVGCGESIVGEARFKGPEDGWWWENTDSEYSEQIFPTHWMPLPAAPDATRAAEQVGMSEANAQKVPPPNAGEGLDADAVDRKAQELFRARWPGKAWDGPLTSRSYWRRQAARALRSNSPEAG